MLGLIIVILGLQIGGMKLVEPETSPETLTYTLRAQGEKKGISTYTRAREEYKGVDAIKLTMITVTEGDTIPFHDTVTVFIDAKSLSPMYSHRSMAGKIKAEITARYEKEKAKVNLKTEMGSKDIDIKIPEESVDNEEITFLFRWLDEKGPKKGTLVDVAPGAGTTVEIKWEVKGDTTITLQKKKLETSIVELNFLGRKVRIFYEKEKPRRMVRYMDASTGTELILKEE